MTILQMQRKKTSATKKWRAGETAIAELMRGAWRLVLSFLVAVGNGNYTYSHIPVTVSSTGLHGIPDVATT